MKQKFRLKILILLLGVVVIYIGFSSKYHTNKGSLINKNVIYENKFNMGNRPHQKEVTEDTNKEKFYYQRLYNIVYNYYFLNISMDCNHIDIYQTVEWLLKLEYTHSNIRRLCRFDKLFQKLVNKGYDRLIYKYLVEDTIAFEDNYKTYYECNLLKLDVYIIKYTLDNKSIETVLKLSFNHNFNLLNYDIFTFNNYFNVVQNRFIILNNLLDLPDVDLPDDNYIFNAHSLLIQILSEIFLIELTNVIF